MHVVIFFPCPLHNNKNKTRAVIVKLLVSFKENTLFALKTNDQLQMQNLTTSKGPLTPFVFIEPYFNAFIYLETGIFSFSSCKAF